MTEAEFLDILNSDMKLWGAAGTTDNGDGTITKSIDLPGLYPLNVRMPFNDAASKRNALGAFGATVRQAFQDARSDEAISARVAKKTRQVEQADSGSGLRDSAPGVPEQGPQAAADESPEGPYQEDATRPPDLRESLTARRVEIGRRLGGLEAQILRLNDEYAALTIESKKLDKMLAVLEDDDGEV